MLLPVVSLSAANPKPSHSTDRRRARAVTRPGASVKTARRLLSSLHAAPDEAVAESLVRKFVAGSSKSTSLGALSFLLSLSSPFAAPFYSKVSKTDWFRWQPKTAASIAALLELQDESNEAEILIADSVSRLRNSPKDLSIFYSDLITSLCHHGLNQKANEVYAELQSMPILGQKSFELLVKSLCVMGNPTEAEGKLKEMVLLGYRPSSFLFSSIAQSYGKLGHFSEVERVIGSMEECGLEIDSVCANIILSCYANHGELARMVTWLKKMRELGVCFSVRTYNTCLGSCQNILQMINEIDSLPLSLSDLIQKLEDGCGSCQNEAMVVKELINSSLLAETLYWSESEAKLDLHGFNVASAYVILLQWIEEMQSRFGMEGTAISDEILVVTGMGKHSVSGKSTIRGMVSRILSRMDCPLRMDRRNVGRFVARGKAVKDWLCRLG